MKNFFIEKRFFTLIVLNIITILLMALNSMYPGMLFMNSFLLPIPAAIILAIYDKKTFLVSTLINVTITMIITQNIILTLITGLMVLTLGIIIGKSVKEKEGIGISLLKIFSVTITLSILIITMYIYFIEKTNLTEVYNVTKKVADEFLNEFYKFENTNAVILSTEDILANIPTMFILYYMINSVINYLITMKVVLMLKKEKAYLKPFSEYYLSNIVGAFIIVILCFGIILDKSGFSIGMYISNSFYSILDTLLIINGLAFTYNFLINKFKYSKTISIISLIVTFFILTDVFVILGFVEMIIDFRRLDPHRIFKRK